MEGGGPGLPEAPALVVGRAADVAVLRATAGLTEPPEVAEVVSAGTARAWIERRAKGTPVIFVSGDNPAALEAAVRALPHYRSRSYIVFEGSRAARTGLWRVSESPLSRRLGG